MPRFTAVTRPTGQSSAANTLTALIGSSLGRADVRSLSFNVETTAPFDGNITYKLNRFTAGASQSSAFTDIGYMDPADAGNNRITVRQNATVEPTYASAAVWQGTVNARMPYRLDWAPDVLRISTASNNGLGLTAAASVSGLVFNVAWDWNE